MRPLTTFILPLLTPLTTGYLDPSSLHRPGTPMTQYTSSGSLLHPSPFYRPWLTTPSDSGNDSLQPSWYRPHPHASYHNTTYHLNQDPTPQSFSPRFSEFDDPRYVTAFLEDVDKEQEKEWWRSQAEEIDSLPRGAKVCLVLAGILFAYLLLEAVAVWWLDTAEARAERQKERGRRIVKRWWKRYSFVGAVRRWGGMTRVQMGITPGGPNSSHPALAPPPRREQSVDMPMRRRSFETGRVETRRFEQHLPSGVFAGPMPYNPEVLRQMQEEINQLPAYEAVAPRRPFGGMPGSPLWFAKQARRAFRGRG